MASPFLFEATDANFDAEVLKSNVTVVVDFWAPWCGPCRQIAPILDKVAPLYEGRVLIAKFNVDNWKRVPSSLGIQSIPTLIAFRNGQVVGRMVGFSGVKSVTDFVEKATA